MGLLLRYCRRHFLITVFLVHPMLCLPPLPPFPLDSVRNPCILCARHAVQDRVAVIATAPLTTNEVGKADKLA